MCTRCGGEMMRVEKEERGMNYATAVAQNRHNRGGVLLEYDNNHCSVHLRQRAASAVQPFIILELLFSSFRRISFFHRFFTFFPKVHSTGERRELQPSSHFFPPRPVFSTDAR